MSARPLPRALAPLDGESLPGLILRLAYRLELSPARIAALCSLNHRQNRIPAQYILNLAPERCTAFAASTHLRADEAQALTLSSLADIYPPLQSVRMDGNRNTAAVNNHWAANLSSRFCPECLAGDGSPIQDLYGGPWKLGWHLPISFACTTHNRMLAHHCPDCAGVPNRPANTERQGLILQRTTSGLHPAQCRHPKVTALGAKATPYGTRLDGTLRSTTITDADLPLVLALQQRIAQRLLLDPPPPAPTKPAAFFPDLIVAAQLICLSWPLSAQFAPSTGFGDLIDRHISRAARPQASPSAARRPAHSWAAPQDPAVCAAFLLAADTLLGEDHTTDPTLTDRVGPLATAAYRRHTANIGATLRRRHVSRHLVRALVPRTQGFYRAGGHRHARQQIPSRHSQFEVRHVPALVPEAWLCAHFDDLLTRWTGHSDWDVRHLRRVASLKLAEMSGGGAWPQCAQALGIPWNTAQHSLKTLREKLAPHHLWPVLGQSVENLARHLDCGTQRTDFQLRRATLLHWRLPDTHWLELTDGLDQFQEGPTSPTRDAATVLIWAEVTHGDRLHSPLLVSLREAGRSTRQLVASINQLCTPANRKGTKRELLNRIEAYANRLGPTSDVALASTSADHDVAPL
ncbi:TniQ family protein [Streptomyces sp. NPDC002932]|uniref:TniQ family protein n=1 Tax=Streptomyces sp. NPDC002932 TaxID=3364672 RepID=UPI0036A9F919